ncbi:DUF5011 domain-containing protein [Sporosarcina sp. ANT_H38]|uniref:NPCBM/NEW2 domain-containing protein n=1 Tax=Sporosarcina sp. ANT_H38 TaxID=2597358 RepID=UPI00165D3A3D|nr:NPCBM/NEW2 domain-containing protein [Sporosarcina sp. ANT_H38]
MTKFMAIILSATLIFNMLSGPVTVLAQEVKIENEVTNAIEGGDSERNKAKVSKFDLYEDEIINSYNQVFKIDKSTIKSITGNGGRYANSFIEYAIDGNLNTHWETGKPNTSDFKNEVIVHFDKTTQLNRIVYAARQSSAKGKGFAQEFEIYSSTTDDGDFQLVSSGEYKGSTGDVVEIQFAPTEFKRIKFVFTKANQDWASASELIFYKEDAVSDKIESLFTDGTMSKVIDSYNSIEKINTLEIEANTHPLYESKLKEILDLARAVVSGKVETEGTLVVAEQRGDMVKHANQKLKFGFGNNLQPTGFAAQPGDKITVYVDANTKGPLPKLSFAQQEGAWSSWRKDVNLVAGKNIITVPAIAKDGWYKKAVTPGGSIYIINPYTEEEQGKAPVLRFEGAAKIPFATANTDLKEFKSFLIDYKKKLDEDIAQHPIVEEREVLDVFEFVSDHIMWTGTATGAYKTYIEDGYSPLETIKSYNIHMKELFRYYGLDASSEVHDPKYIRESVRLAQPYAYMYAAGDHIGTLDDVMANHLIPFEVRGPSWGLTHEIGHKMDVNARLYGETTNNMLPQYMSTFYNKTDMRIPYEDNIYKNVLKENLKDYSNQGFFEKLGVYWQIELYSPGYWGKLNRVYREKNIQLIDGDSSKQQYLVEFSSEVLGIDLSEHFARHGFMVNKETREKTSKYPKPDKLWYLNDSVVGYKGNGIADKNASVGVNLVSNAGNKNNTLSFTLDKSYREDFLGYEIVRNGEIVGFTSSNSFIDKDIDTNKNYTYQVVVYDKKLNALKPVEINSFRPVLSVEEHVTLKLHQAFDPMDYVKAITYQGEDITQDVIVKSTDVDVAKKGNYEVVYEVINEDIKEIKTTKVTVVSDYAYISDKSSKLASVGWADLKKDKAPAGGTITLLRQGVAASYAKGIGVHANSEVVYDIEGEGYDFFESYIGIDQSMKGKKSSATFEVWIDGEKKFGSDVFQANTLHEFVKIPVTGAKEIKLVTTDANNNGNESDHTVWADAKFVKNSSKPSLTIPEEITAVKLNSEFDMLKDVQAFDAEDGNLKEHIKVKENGFTVNKTGTYNIEYSVTDSDGNEVMKTRRIAVYSASKYVSDIPWESARTDHGTVGKDKSSTNSTIKLLVNGEVKEFDKGIGTHANAEIVYNLTNSNYEYLETYIGVDRNIAEQTNSSIIFKVLADGKEVYNSGIMKYNTAAKLIRIPVKDVSQLKLVIDNAGNGISSDHGSFGNAAFLLFNNAPELTIPKSVSTKVGQEIKVIEAYSAIDAEDGDLTSHVEVTGENQVNFERAGKYNINYKVVDSDGNEVIKTRTIAVVDMEDYNYLSDFDWKSTQNSYAAPLKNQSISWKTLRLNDELGNEVSYEKGIGAHSNTTIVYDLTDKKADYFTSFVGVDRQMHGSIGSVTFEVYVDGVKKFESGLMNSRDPQKFIEIDTNGAKELKLVVTDGGNGNGSDHATWGDTKLHYANSERVYKNNLEQAIEVAKALNTEVYTEESVQAFESSVIKAEELLVNKEATQTAVDQAVEELKQATEALLEVVLDSVITIKDKYLEQSIKSTLGLTGNITLGDMYNLTSLTNRTGRVITLEGLEHAKNLIKLDIDGNKVTDFSPLKGLRKLENVAANSQIIAVGEARGPVAEIENIVIDVNGSKVLPKEVRLKKTNTGEVIIVDVNDFAQNVDKFTIDLSNESQGYYALEINFNVNENEVKLLYMIINK